ncbi:RNA-binding protein 33-like [Mytilus trossulus]|uniref:RNA-binding protein 33-like n=1 Tax=Mytilus trossulus TaxID=6551 RepID=UPI003007A356
MPRKRPTETSWDSDEDELLNETDTFSITSRSKEFDEELDEEALLGSDEETENDKVSIGESLSAKDTTKYGKPIATVTSMTNARRISPINWDQNANKSDDFEFEETADDIELYAPDDSTDFDVGTSQDYQPYTEEPAVEESINEEAEETETTFDQSHVTADTTRDESDESEDEEDTRRGRFKSERQDIVTSTTKTKTTKQAASADIPDNLEISDEQQAQINEFMATKDRKRRPNQRVRPFQQYRQMHPSRIQTITSTHMHHQPSPPPIMHPPPPVFAAPPQPRPKIHVNPAFYNRGMRPQSTTMTSVHNQPLMFDSSPRSQPPLFHHEPPRHFDERIPPLMDSYRHDRSSYNQGPPLPQHHHPPPHHQFGHPPASQPYPGPPRFQQPQDSRPLYGGPPPHVNSGNFGGSQPHPHEHPPYHRGPPGPNFPHDIPPRPDEFRGNHFDRHRHGSPGPRHFDQHGPMEPPRPNPFLQEQRFQPQPRMHQQPPTRMHQPNQPRMHQQVQPRMPHQPRNNIRPQRQPLMSSHRPLNGQQTPNNRFQGPRPSLQQQAGNKVLQKVKKEARMKKFGAIQNIPVIGRQTIKRPSSEEESSSPPKQLKSGIMTKVEDDYLKKIAAQKEMRAAIQRQKELKRQQTATIRRKELEEKLAKQGKDISELESADSESSDSASQISTTSVGRGQPLNRGQGQRGHPSNRGQVQSAQPSNQGQFARGNPGGRGQRGQQRGFPSNRGQAQQHQTIEGTSFQGNGRGRGVQRGRGNNTGRGGQLLRRGQTMEVHGSGPVTLLKSYTVTNVNEKGDIPETGDNFVDRRTAVEVIEDFRRQKQLKAQEESGASNRQVKVPTVKRMKKIIRTKRNAQGDILSQETVMVPLTPEEEAAAEAKFASQTIPTPVMLSPQKSPQRVVVASNREVVLGDQGGSTRTVIASSPPAGITSYQGGDSKRTVRIDNLSLSTSDNTIKSLCGCVGPFQGYQRAGKSAFIVFMDSKNASEFKNKYNRHMLDLSHISVELIPDLRPL